MTQSGSAQYTHLRKAILAENWDDVRKCITVKSTVKNWMLGEFSYADNKFKYSGVDLPHKFHNRLVEMAANNEDPSPLLRFWERLQKNPSYRSVQQLWNFLEHQNIPLTKDGCFLGYKSVDDNFRDWHSGKFVNKPGTRNEMPRNQISDDQKVDCAAGFHIGTLKYAKDFHGGSNQQIVICKIDPQDVVSVPDDCSSQKIRVCKYFVVGHWNGEPMPSTTIVDLYCDDVDAKFKPEDKVEAVIVVPDEMSDEEIAELEDEENEDDYADSDDEGLTDGQKTDKEMAPSIKAIHQAVNALDKAKGPRSRKVPKLGPDLVNKLTDMGTREMLDQPLDVLRAYAGNVIKIVGASKIPGGKTALVAKIISTRSKAK